MAGGTVLTWTSNKRTGEIRTQQGRLIATTELGQRQHTELLGQAVAMRELLDRCLSAGGLDHELDSDIRKMIFKTR